MPFLFVWPTGKQYVLAAMRVTMNRMIENGDEIDDANFPKVGLLVHLLLIIVCDHGAV